MSWDAELTDDRGHQEGWWNYTHNTNGMIEAALGDEIDDTLKPWWTVLGNTAMGKGSWWDLLDGSSGPEGAALLDHIIRNLEAEPGRFKEMNPENGWGDYDGLLGVLREMRDRVPEWPTTWSVDG